MHLIGNARHHLHYQLQAGRHKLGNTYATCKALLNEHAARGMMSNLTAPQGVVLPLPEPPCEPPRECDSASDALKDNLSA